MKDYLVQIENLNLNYGAKSVVKDLNWTICRGENWLLSGLSGSGKTTLGKAIAGKINSLGKIQLNFDQSSSLVPSVFFVASWYQFTNLEGVANFYYQQRYNKQQARDTNTVEVELFNFGKENNLAVEELSELYEKFNFTDFNNSELIELSSGEHKKLQLIKAVWLKPQLLILDQPYTGLDFSSRQNFNLLLNALAKTGVQIIMISNEPELPNCINCFAFLDDGKLIETTANSLMETTRLFSRKLPNFLNEVSTPNQDVLVKMSDVNIHYGQKQVLKNVDWEIKTGEKWLLQGHNGSGKSTLLSLINGDHPQAYANDLHLFGNKRGSGESIWDIKKNIGLISPEFHWYFDRSSTVKQSIASGFLDSVGLYRQLGEEKQKQVNALLYYFELEQHQNEQLGTLPLGKQRLVLLARAIIKNPSLLILDEPCQGLDRQQTDHFNQLIDEIASEGKTLIHVAHTEAQLPKCLNHRLILAKGEIIENTKSQVLQKDLTS